MSKARFITPLTFREIPGSKIIVLTAPFQVYSAVLNQMIVVPVGFMCDRESIPRIPLVYWLCGSSSDEGGVIHDYLYRSNCVPEVNRSQADSVFYEFSRLDGNNLLTSYMKWLGVRGGGNWAWHQHKVLDDLTKEN